jgi:hypothetical protein
VALSRTSSSRCRYQPLQCYGYMVDTPSGILCHSSSNCYQIFPPTRSTFHSRKSRFVLASRLGSEAVSSSDQHGSTCSRGTFEQDGLECCNKKLSGPEEIKAHIGSSIEDGGTLRYGGPELILCKPVLSAPESQALPPVFVSASTCQLGHCGWENVLRDTQDCRSLAVLFQMTSSPYPCLQL